MFGVLGDLSGVLDKAASLGTEAEVKVAFDQIVKGLANPSWWKYAPPVAAVGFDLALYNKTHNRIENNFEDRGWSAITDPFDVQSAVEDKGVWGGLKSIFVDGDSTTNHNPAPAPAPKPQPDGAGSRGGNGSCATNTASPVGEIFRQEGVKIVIYSNDHAPPHAHVIGGGTETRIGQNGKPLAGDPELTKKQQKVVDDNINAIRDAISEYMRWYRENC
jgi:Domain of unknown function (DUF4160)